MEKSVIVKVKNVYGVERIYPYDETAELFAKLTGKKTFDRVDLKFIRELGYEIKVMAEVL